MDGAKHESGVMVNQRRAASQGCPNKKDNDMIIAIDFDGTICRGAFPQIDGQQPYAGEVITRLHAAGHYVIIWTCRTGTHLLDAINWLLEENIPFSRVNDGNPENVRKYGNEGRKLYAHVYIDDKNLGGFPGWKEAESLIADLEKSYLNRI